MIPITHGWQGKLPQTVDLANHPGRWEIGNTPESKWRNGDAMLFNWFEQVRSMEARRYVFLEWDCYCSTNVRKFYKDVWDVDLACSQIIHQHDKWDWWEELPQLGGVCTKGLGVVPMAGVMLSEWLLESIRDMEMDEDGSPPLPGIFSELRLGTLANLVGAIVKEIPRAKEKFITAAERVDGPCNGPGIYHKISH